MSGVPQNGHHRKPAEVSNGPVEPSPIPMSATVKRRMIGSVKWVVVEFHSAAGTAVAHFPDDKAKVLANGILEAAGGIVRPGA